MPKLNCGGCGKSHNFGANPGRFVCNCGHANEADPKLAAKIAADAAGVAQAKVKAAAEEAEKLKADADRLAEKAKAAQLSTPETVKKEIADTGATKSVTAESEKKPLGFETGANQLLGGGDNPFKEGT